MFDDRFGLTAAVYEGWKNMTRRPARKKYIKDTNGNLSWNGEYLPPRYKVGEIVAVAQKYKDMMPYLADSFRQPSPKYMMDKPGYNNKMFVRADLMPTRIRITADVLYHYPVDLCEHNHRKCMRDHRQAYAQRISPVSFVIKHPALFQDVYEFELKK